MFPKEIECDLSLYHHIDIGEWHAGRLSSRKLLNLLDGLPGESWYKLSSDAFIKEFEAEQENIIKRAVHGQIFAQLMGQKFE